MLGPLRGYFFDSHCSIIRLVETCSNYISFLKAGTAQPTTTEIRMINDLMRTVATWVELWSILCQVRPG